MKNSLFTCQNCVRFGQPWKRGRSLVVCDQEQDDDGNYYTASHEACEYFIPIQNALPPEIQQIRLLVQSLSPEHASYFSWALKQRDLVVDLKDAGGDPLSLGDYVSFRYDLHRYTGTIESADPDNKKYGAVIINCPAFPSANISLVSSSITKIPPSEAKAIARELMPEKMKADLEWQITAISHEIAALRARRNLSPEDRERLMDFEERLLTKNCLLRYNSSLLTIAQ